MTLPAKVTDGPTLFAPAYGESNRVELRWSTADARYHVWLNRDTREVATDYSGQAYIYKNPLEGAPHFEPRSLRLDVPKNREFVERMIGAIDWSAELAKFEKQRAQAAKERAEAARTYRAEQRADRLVEALVDTIAFVEGYAESAEADDPVFEMLPRLRTLLDEINNPKAEG